MHQSPVARRAVVALLAKTIPAVGARGRLQARPVRTARGPSACPAFAGYAFTSLLGREQLEVPAESWNSLNNSTRCRPGPLVHRMTAQHRVRADGRNSSLFPTFASSFFCLSPRSVVLQCVNSLAPFHLASLCAAAAPGKYDRCAHCCLLERVTLNLQGRVDANAAGARKR